MAAKEKEKDLLEKGWIRAWMLFEVQAASKEVTEKALAAHIKKMKAEKGVHISEESYTETSEMEAPKQLVERGITKVYARVVEVVALFRSFEELVNAVINYAPTAIEITSPEKMAISMREAQNALASISDMMHKFASAGLGGMVIKGE